MKIIEKGFKNERLGIELDIYIIDGKEWFKDSDVSKFLDYRDSHNMKRSIDLLKDNSIPRITSNGYNAHYINEVALYECVLKIRDSQTDSVKHNRYTKAREFQKWIFEEVLPSLRQNNFYVDNDNINDEELNKLRKKVESLEIQRNNFQNVTENNPRKRCVLKKYLEHMFVDTEDVYEQFIRILTSLGLIDLNRQPTELFLSKNKVKKLFIHNIETCGDTKENFSVTGEGMSQLAKSLYVKDGVLKSTIPM